MKIFAKIIGTIIIGALVATTAVYAGKGGGHGGGGGSWPSSTSFTFNYNVGTTATNYHAYGVAGQVGTITQPANTVILIHWYVKDLGAVTGTGLVSCPAEASFPSMGILLFADAADIGGDGSQETNAFPIPMVINQSGTATIQIDLQQDNDSDDPGVALSYPVLYNGPLFTNFGWDISGYVWNVEPIGFDND